MLIHEKTRSVCLKVDDPFRFRDLIPKSRTLRHPDYNIAFQHTEETAQIARNLGYDVPSPALMYYDWPKYQGIHPPMAHQREMAEFTIKHKRCFNLSEMGTGKTAGTLWAVDAMMKAGIVNKCAILSPLSTLSRVWQQDIFDVLMHRVSVVVHGGRDARAKAFAANVDFYVINHDGIAIEQVIKELRKRTDINCVVVDEGSIFRNAQTQKWKGLKAALRPDTRVIWLTGTPCPNAPTDAWAQAQIICPERVPQFFGSFKRQTMTQVSPFKWTPKTGSHEMAFNAMQPAIRFKKEDCIDLPPVVKLDRQAELTPEQKREFHSMKEDMIAEAKQQQITAVNAADKIGKLRQILCGCVKHPESGNYLVLPHAPRLKVLKECIEQASAKVIVIVPFKGIIETLAKELREDYTVGVLNGDVSIRTRNEIIEDFKYTAEPHVLLCHPKVMSHGLNLTEADTLVFYAPIYSNDEYQQVTERFNRKGQTRKMTIVRIAAHPIEWQIYRVIDDRKLSQDTILDLYHQITD